MDITPEEAQASLNDIRNLTTKARTVHRFLAYYMLLWGIVWTLGFLATQFELQLVNWIWGVMIFAGMIGSAILGATQGGQMRAVPGSQTAFLSSRFGIFNGVLYAFAILWLIVFSLTPLQVAMLWITVTMFSAIIAGVWLRVPASIWLGVGVTIMSLLGYYLLPHYFWFWAAIFAGLPLVGMGIYGLRQK